MSNQALIQANLHFVYGEEKGNRIIKSIEEMIDTYTQHIQPQSKRWVDEEDVMLITYGDSIKSGQAHPLQDLKEFLEAHVGNTINSVHLLPFYPFTSDDGFSVQDYLAVNPEVGTWEDVESLSNSYDLMFDAVINHISSKSEWFTEYLKGNEAYQDYFVEADPEADYSSIVRPRALPLLTRVDHVDGEKHVWTTFSEDQIDLNYESEALFLHVLDILAQYVAKGARYLRLDAIGFLWKRLNTTSIHLEETHRLVQVMRSVLEEIAPGTIIITETNVPHKENISYFGDGSNEAHMVYQFPLPPLTLHALMKGNARHLTEWADSLEPTTSHTSFFNFLASHDGVGLRPVEGILSSEEVNQMVDQVKENGGLVSYKANGDGTESPYELNINYFSALAKNQDTMEQNINRFLAAQTILLSVQGVPGIYIHSLLGSFNDLEGVEATGRNRSINREKLNRSELEKELTTEGTVRHRTFHTFLNRIDRRKQETAFHPNADQEVLVLDERLFSIVRTNRTTGEKILVLINVSEETVRVKEEAVTDYLNTNHATDILSGSAVTLTEDDITIQPYQALWLKEV